ncbi:unnamed protein product [Brassica oleracea var. botrytis]
MITCTCVLILIRVYESFALSPVLLLSHFQLFFMFM